jgi:methylmalonyl-CoA mutase
MNARILEEAGFEPAGEADWRRLVEKALKGADFDDTLVSHSDDGIAYGPIAGRDSSGMPHMRADPCNGWTVVQRVDDADGERAAAQLAADLDGGATGIAFCLARTPGAHGFGIAAPSIDTHLRAIGQAVELRFETPLRDAGPIIDLFAERDELCGHVDFGLAPHSDLAFSGTPIDANGFARLSERAFDLDLPCTIMRADGRVAHNAGGSEAQELAFAVAAAVEMMRLAEGAGVSPEDALAATEFALAADQDQFLGIAKFRALRQLHARLQDALRIDQPFAAHIHAETSWRMLTRRDPETNILRGTIAVFAAGVGGADSVSVLPHTLRHGLPDRFARRIARNTQTVLIEESHLAFVADPAAGSGGIEQLTAALAERAWAEFQQIEREGGLARSLADGAFGGRVRDMAAKRNGEIAAGRRPVVGTTIYPAARERPVEVLAPLPDPMPAEGQLAPVAIADIGAEGKAA